MVVRSNSSDSPLWAMRKPPLSMMRAVVASLLASNSFRTWSSCRMSSSRSCGSVGISRGCAGALADEFVQQQAGDHVERFEDALASVRGRSEGRDLHVAIVEQELHVFHRRGVGQITFVELQDIGNVVHVQFQGL